MNEAARIGDMTTHGGVLAPIGHPKVLINNLPSSALADLHMCAIHKPGPVTTGSATVSINNLQAARKGDFCNCTATIDSPCSTNVTIGGASVPYRFLDTQNCYGYSSGVNMFRQPGETSGTSWSNDIQELLAEMNVATLKQRLIADLGQPMADPTQPAPDGQRKIVFVAYDDIDPTSPLNFSEIRWDFHVYRQDSDGYWSHKRGSMPLERFDASFEPITDPALADRGDYTQIVGTWLVDD